MRLRSSPRKISMVQCKTPLSKALEILQPYTKPSMLSMQHIDFFIDSFMHQSEGHPEKPSLSTRDKSNS